MDNKVDKVIFILLKSYISALDERDFDILAMIYHLPIYIFYNYNRKTLTDRMSFDSLPLPFYRKALKFLLILL